MLLMIETSERNRYCNSLTGAGRSNQSGKIRRSSLLPTQQSAFMQLFLFQEDDVMITMTEFSYGSFIQLLECFTPYYESYNPIVGSGENIRSLLLGRMGREDLGWLPPRSH